MVNFSILFSLKYYLDCLCTNLNLTFHKTENKALHWVKFKSSVTEFIWLQTRGNIISPPKIEKKKVFF